MTNDDSQPPEFLREQVAASDYMKEQYKKAVAERAQTFKTCIGRTSDLIHSLDNDRLDHLFDILEDHVDGPYAHIMRGMVYQERIGVRGLTPDGKTYEEALGLMADEDGAPMGDKLEDVMGDGVLPTDPPAIAADEPEFKNPSTHPLAGGTDEATPEEQSEQDWWDLAHLYKVRPRGSGVPLKDRTVACSAMPNCSQVWLNLEERMKEEAGSGGCPTCKLRQKWG